MSPRQKEQLREAEQPAGLASTGTEAHGDLMFAPESPIR